MGFTTPPPGRLLVAWLAISVILASTLTWADDDVDLGNYGGIHLDGIHPLEEKQAEEDARDKTPTYNVLDETTRVLNSTSKLVVIAPTPKPKERFNYYVAQKDGNICIGAVFKTSFDVSYVTRQRKNHRIRLREAVIPLPSDAETHGTCGANSSTLVISWNKGNYSLKIDFHRKKEKTKNEEDSDEQKDWGATNVEFTVNTADKTHFQYSLHPGKHTTRSSGSIEYFQAPRNRSYLCDTTQKLVLKEYRNGSIVENEIHRIIMDIWDVHIQAFDMPSTGEFSQAAVCEADSLKNIPRKNIVPVIVAACLAGIILIMIVAYVVSKNMGASAYRAMD